MQTYIYVCVRYSIWDYLVPNSVAGNYKDAQSSLQALVSCYYDNSIIMGVNKWISELYVQVREIS